MLRELLALFDLQVEDKQLKSAHAQLDNFKSALGTVAKAIAGAFAVHEISSFLGEQIKLGAELDDQAQRLGVTTDELQRFQYAAKLTGVETEGASHGLMHLNKALGEAIGGGEEQAKTFAKLGVKIKDASGAVRPLSEIVPDLADGFSKLKSPQEQTAMAMSIFGRQGAALIPLLRGGKEGVAGLYKEFDQLGGGLSHEFIQAAAKADDELDRFRFTFGIFKSRVAMEVLPTLTELVSKLVSFTVWCAKVAKQTNALTVGLYALVTVVGLLVAEWLILNIEIVAIVAIFALLFLAVEDIYTLFTGGDSVIGRFIDRLFGVGASKKFVEGVNEAVHDVIAAFEALGPIVKAVGSTLVDIWTAAKPIMESFFGDGTEDAQGLFDVIKDAGRTAVLIWADLAETIGRAVASLDDIVPPWLRVILGDDRIAKLGAAQVDSAQRLRAIVEPPTVAPTDAQQFMTRGARAAPSIGTQSNQVSVTVQGGMTNADTGAAVATAVRKALTQADVNAAHAAVSGNE